MMRSSNIVWNGSTQNVPCCGNQAVEASTSETLFNFPDANLQEDEKMCLESEHEDGNSIIFSEPKGELNDQAWRSLASGFRFQSGSDVDDRKLSSESIDSDISLHARSLDDVFDVIDEMDLLESGLATNASLTTPSTDRMDCVSQLPIAHNSDPSHSFQSSDLRPLKRLQNPSFGVVTAVTRLRELLSKPRSDHLNHVFARLLNKALKEMEDAVQHQSNRAPGGRENETVSDAERTFEPVSSCTKPNRSFSSKSESSPALLRGRSSEDLEDCEKGNF